MENGQQWQGKLCYAYGTSLTSQTWGKYIPWLERLSGLAIVNHGLPAQGLTNLGGCSTGKTKEAIMNLDDGKQQADLILLEVGANEGGPYGEIFDTGDDTFCGCLNQSLRYLLQNTAAQIVVIPSTVLRDAPEDCQYYYNYLLKTEEVCKINRVWFLGHADGMGQARLKDNDRFIWDNVHQTDLGGYNRAVSVWSMLKHVPLFNAEIPQQLDTLEGGGQL